MTEFLSCLVKNIFRKVGNAEVNCYTEIMERKDSSRKTEVRSLSYLGAQVEIPFPTKVLH